MNTTQSLNTAASQFSFMATVTLLATGEQGWVVGPTEDQMVEVAMLDGRVEVFQPSQLVSC